MTNLNLADWLPGVQAMANLHPLVVHFPIALLVSFWLAAVLARLFRSPSLHQAASWMLYFGAAASALAVAAGFHAEDTVDHSEEVHAILERHETLGLSVLGLSVLLSIVRWLNSRWNRGSVSILELAAGVVLVGALSAGADLGGLMVYGHGVGVRSTCPDAETAAALPPPATSRIDEVAGTAGTVTKSAGDEPAAHSHKHSHHHHHHHH